MSGMWILTQAARQHVHSRWADLAWGVTALPGFSLTKPNLFSHLSTSSACHEVHNQDGASSSREQRPAARQIGAAASLGLQAKLNQQLEGMRLELPNSPFAKGRRGPDVPRQILYKGAGMLMFRFLVRAKVFQLLGVFTAVVLILTAVTSPTQLQTFDLMAGVAVLVGCIVTSYCLWFYSSRYVGELSLLLPEKRVARFSVLDFWGNRQDHDIPIQLIQPPFKGRSPAEVKALTARMLMPIDVTGDRQYYISVPHGKLVQKEVLQKMCFGTWLPELDAAAQGQAAGGTAQQAGAAATQHAAIQQGVQGPPGSKTT